MLKAQNISVKIGKHELLQGINLEAKQGEITALIGPNGAGKSTLLKSISGDISHGGDFWLHNTCIQEYPKKELAQVKAVLLQKSQLQFDFKVQEVTMMGRYPHFKHLPSKNDHTIVEKYQDYLSLNKHAEQVHLSLSGGEQQRNHFARVLAQLDSNNLLPKLLLLDEPLNNLDVKYQYQFMEMLQEFVAKGNAVIVVMHDLNLTAEFAHHIVLLKEGKVAASGAPEKVYTKKTLEECYEIPVHVQQHPFKNHPMVLFNLIQPELENSNQSYHVLNK